MEGYAKLASLMGAHPAVIFIPRFGALTAQNLLYLQAELDQLEPEFREWVTFAKDWFTLAHADGGHEKEAEYQAANKAKIEGIWCFS